MGDLEELLHRQKNLIARPFDLTGKPMNGWLLVSTEGTKNRKDFDFWVNTAVESNKKATAKPTKKK